MHKKDKKAAIELSIGTVVIIVLAISMLILGVILIRSIFASSTDNVKQIDRGVKNAITKLFSENNEKKVVLYPESHIIKLKQGATDEGFAISIRNTDTGGTPSDFTYTTTMVATVTDLNTNCGRSEDPTTSWARIVAGRSLSAGSAISLSPGNFMEDPIHVRFSISEVAPICLFRIKVDVEKGG